MSFDLYGYIAPRAPVRTARAAAPLQASPEPQPQDAPQPMSGGNVDATE